MKNKIQHIEVIICLFIVIATLIVYGQVRNQEFPNFDDTLYITENPHVQNGLSLKGVIWSFTAGTDVSNYWHPVTWLSHMLDYQLYGSNPMGHNWTNLLIHIANIICLFFIFKRMTGALWRSGFVAALFAIHPLNVEVVAWVAERKDLLCTLFWFLSMWAYIRYVEAPGFNRYFLVLLFFMLGLMSKPMIVTLPFVLLLLDYWPLGRMQWGWTNMEHRPGARRFSALHLVVEKTPFFLLSAVASVAAFVTQKKGGALAPLDFSFLKINILNAINSYISYIGKMIWPSSLAVFYPNHGILSMWKTAFAFLLLICLSVIFIRQWKRFPYLIVGWFWYLGTLVPVIGLVRIGSFSMADRYAYVPIIGLFLIIAWGVSDFISRWRFRRIILFVSSGAVLSMFGLCAWLQVGYWRNSISLFEHTINVTDNNWLAHNNLGKALAEKGKVNDAVYHFKHALKIKPDHIQALNNLGTALASKDRLDEAFLQYKKAIKIQPDSDVTLYNLGRVMFDRKNFREAIYYFKKVLKINPEYAGAHHNMAILLTERGEFDEAKSHYNHALRVKPDDPNIHWSLGDLLTKQGKFKEAVDHYASALALIDSTATIKVNPEYAKIYNKLGLVMTEMGKLKEARIFFLKAIQIDPDYQEARKNLANLRSKHE